MYIQLICVGKIKEAFYTKAMQEYTKRLKAYHRLEIIEIADEKDPKNDSPEAIAALLAKEEERIRKRMAPNSFLIALAIDSKAFSSEEFAAYLGNLESLGKTHLTFLIGGSYGIAAPLLREADLKLSFSKFTFPHQLMRVIFVEQLYRSCRILNGQKYHK